MNLAGLNFLSRFVNLFFYIINSAIYYSKALFITLWEMNFSKEIFLIDRYVK